MKEGDRERYTLSHVEQRYNVYTIRHSVHKPNEETETLR